MMTTNIVNNDYDARFRANQLKHLSHNGKERLIMEHIFPFIPPKDDLISIRVNENIVDDCLATHINLMDAQAKIQSEITELESMIKRLEKLQEPKKIPVRKDDIDKKAMRKEMESNLKTIDDYTDKVCNVCDRLEHDYDIKHNPNSLHTFPYCAKCGIHFKSPRSKSIHLNSNHKKGKGIKPKKAKSVKLPIRKLTW